MTTFSHSGDFTETIFHLPILQQKGGGELVLYPHECTSHRMTRERAAVLTPLCEAQPYIRQVRWAEQGEGLILDDWRHHKQQHLNLTDLACVAFGVPFPPREQPWLFAVPNRKARVIFHRSSRHHNWNFDWQAIYDKYHAEAVFVGLAEEHADFCHYVGPVSFVHTTNLLQLAEIIQGCELFIGNQSCPYAIAEGLKVPTILEIGRPNNCHWERVGNIHAWDRDVFLPELDQLPERLIQSVIARGRSNTLILPAECGGMRVSKCRPEASITDRMTNRAVSWLHFPRNSVVVSPIH